jgi:translation initiation factor IF-2
LKDLAIKLQEKPSVLIKILMDMGVMAGINQVLAEQVAEKLGEKFGFKLKKAPDEEELLLRIHQEIDKPQILQARPPVVTFMGHVDHGKTSLLDAIRKSKVVESEHGGITQHIGAYRVVLPQGKITFLDTPGHEAFTAMRARGASITDIVVLVVAADDGVMPQTREAIDHARAAGVPIIVALNKIDKPQANIEWVKKQLSELNLTAEDWGGKTITVPVSAKTGEGIDGLLEMILLEAQMLESKANPNRLARGVVVEAKLTPGKGPVSTLLVQNGTLHLNENILVGKYAGKVRAMFNDLGQAVVEALPAQPVEVLGIAGVPVAGEQFFVIADEKKAKELALLRQEKERLQQARAIKRISLEDLYSQIKEGKIKELKLIIKADVQGSLGAIKEMLGKLQTEEIKLDIIHEGVGSINSSDAILAVASNALILGFNVVVDERAKELASQEGLDIRTYNIIYELANDIKAALEGMLEPKLKKVFLGRLEIRKVFKLSRAGTVAGCFVSKGKIMRTSLADLIRNGETIFEGKVSSLKRFKDDVREVTEGFECGITLAGFEDFKEGDIIEAYDIEKIARKL